jgi:hypothetical protein
MAHIYDLDVAVIPRLRRDASLPSNDTIRFRVDRSARDRRDGIGAPGWKYAAAEQIQQPSGVGGVRVVGDRCPPFSWSTTNQRFWPL